MANGVKSRAGLGWYLEQIKATPLLTADEERDLAFRIREYSDIEAREQMIHANLRLVVNVAKSYSNPGMTLGDLVAEGNLGLLRAVEEFDPDAGVRFSTYAVWWIKQAIKRAMINAGQPIHIPAYLVKLIGRWRKVSTALNARLGRPATIGEMAKAMDITPKKARIIQEGLAAVNAPSQMGSDEAKAISEVVVDTTESRPDHDLVSSGISPMIHKLMARLPEREQRILELRFGLDGHEGPARTFKEIGAIIGLTRERVRQLEKKALANLKTLGEDQL
ncbi:MAG: RNA polymerase sigma factor RpoD/SigA [Phycisphaerales bacterium]|jgi:RNA polymerase primary sigma factor|nr:RNA polymerase sigma factor RpoD/SigA [Phycisphaerales bacterium]